MDSPEAPSQVRLVGRYALYGEIAAGGMATVHFGRLLGPVGFSRTVAIKRLHGQFAKDPEFVAMFLDEARLAGRIRHPNVVPTLDVVATDGELFVVMDYVVGESLAKLARTMVKQGTRMPLRIVSAILSGVLHGLHAAHEAKDERGAPLGIVHRDVSPQNVLVGTDGVPKLLDFGVAKAAGRLQLTQEGQIKGKLAYMPPEQLRGEGVSRKTDVYSAGVVLWELLAAQRLFTGENEAVVVARVLCSDFVPPSAALAERGFVYEGEERDAFAKLEALVLRALEGEPDARFETARDMAQALERSVPPATTSELADWVEAHAGEVLAQRAERIAEIESDVVGQETLAEAVRLADERREDELADDTEKRETVPISSTSGALVSTESQHAVALQRDAGRPETVPLTGPSLPQAGPHRGAYSIARVAFAFAGGAAVLLTVALVARSGGPSKSGVPASAPAPTETAATVLATTSAPSAASAGTASSPSPPIETAPTSAPAPSVGVAHREGKPGLMPKATSAPSATQKKATPKGKDCDPPFVYDATGLRRYKPECLE